MQFSFFSRRQIFSFVFLLLSSVSPLITQAEEAIQGGSVTDLLIKDPPTIGPISSGTPSLEVSSKIYEGLVFEKNGHFFPQLADRWENSKDLKTYIFHLHPGVLWHDGKPFTSADVAFSAKEYWTTQSQFLFQNIARVETPDPHTIIFTFNTPFSPKYVLSVLGGTTGYIIPAHIYQGTRLVDNPANRKPIGTGPFQFKEWKPGQYIIVVRNNNYYRPDLPKLNQIVFQIENNESNRLALLASGQADLALRNPVPLQDIASLKKNPNIVVTADGSKAAAWTLAMDLNTKHEVTSNVQVRRAIDLAIDKQKIVDVAYLGYGRPARGPLTESSPYFDQKLPQSDFDPKKAEVLLDKAGYPIKSDGKRFTLKFVVEEGTRQAADIIKQNLEDIGIGVKMETPDFASGLRIMYKDYDFDITTTTMADIIDPSLQIVQYFWTKGILPGVAFKNASQYSNPEMDKVIEAIFTEPDDRKRKKLLDQFQEIAVRDVPRIVIAETDRLTVYNKRLINAVSNERWNYTSWDDLSVSSNKK